jgi:hypothetical protein
MAVSVSANSKIFSQLRCFGPNIGFNMKPNGRLGRASASCQKLDRFRNVSGSQSIRRRGLEPRDAVESRFRRSRRKPPGRNKPLAWQGAWPSRKVLGLNDDQLVVQSLAAPIDDLESQGVVGMKIARAQ